MRSPTLRPALLAFPILLSACSASSVGGGDGLDEGDRQSSPWNDEDSLATGSAGEAAAGMCSDVNGAAVIETAEQAWLRLRVADPHAALQFAVAIALEGLVTSQPVPSCLELEQGETLIISSESYCVISEELTWNGLLVLDQGDTLTTLVYDYLLVEVADELLILDGRADLLSTEQDWIWETSLEFRFPEDDQGAFGVASDFRGLEGDAWASVSGDPLWGTAQDLGEYLLGVSSLTAGHTGMPLGTTCIATEEREDGASLAVQGDRLYEFVFDDALGACAELTVDGEAAGTFCP